MIRAMPMAQLGLFLDIAQDLKESRLQTVAIEGFLATLGLLKTLAVEAQEFLKEIIEVSLA